MSTHAATPAPRGSGRHVSTDAPTTPRVSVQATVEAFLPHRAAYERLLTHLDAPASMYWAPLDAWLTAHPQARPFFVLAHRGNTLVGAALLTYEVTRFGWRLTKVGVPSEPFALLHADHETAEALAVGIVDALAERTRHWWLWLPDLATNDVCAALLTARVDPVRITASAPTPVLDVGPGTVLSERVSKNTRQASAKARNRIAREGHRLTQTWTDDPVDVRLALPQLIGLHVRRNEHLHRKAVLREDAEQQLFADTVTGHARAGRVRLLTTHIDDALAAFALSLATGERWWVYANYADPAWLHFSPGTLTNAEVVRAACADPGVRVLDWGSGVQRYKMSGGARLEERQIVDATSSDGLQRLRNLRQLMLRVQGKALEDF